MKQRNVLLGFGLRACLGLLAGCGASESAGSQDFGEGEGEKGGGLECTASNDCPPGSFCNEFAVCQELEGAESEGEDPKEIELELSSPSGGARYVYVALTDVDSIARVDSETLAVETTGVGDRPTILRTVPGQDVAVVLNEGSSTVSIVRTAEGVDTVTALDVEPSFNALALSPSGRHAIAYFRLGAGVTELPATLQDVTVLFLDGEDERAVTMSVGFNPREIEFSADGSEGFVITDDGISVLSLDTIQEAGIARTVRVTSDSAEDPATLEVDITPDGEWAFVRRAETAAVSAVSIDTGAIQEIALAAVPTDIDLAQDASLVLVMLREVEQAAVIELPNDVEDPSGVQTIETGFAFGSAEISQDVSRAVLYTNAIDLERIGVLDLGAMAVEGTVLRKGVRGVAIAPDGQTAIVIHNKQPGEVDPSLGAEENIDRSYGYSIMELNERFVELHFPGADIGNFAFSPDGERAFLLVDDEPSELHAVDYANLRSFEVQQFALASRPLEVGVMMQTRRAYVAQSHPSGRLTFLHVDTGATQTVTGFELNSQVIR